MLITSFSLYFLLTPNLNITQQNNKKLYNGEVSKSFISQIHQNYETKLIYTNKALTARTIKNRTTNTPTTQLIDHISPFCGSILHQLSDLQKAERLQLSDFKKIYCILFLLIPCFLKLMFIFVINKGPSLKCFCKFHISFVSRMYQ